MDGNQGLLAFYDSDIGAVVAIDRNGSVVGYVWGSASQFYFETSDCTGEATVTRVVGLPITPATLDLDPGQLDTERRYFAPAGVATQEVRPVISQLGVIFVNSQPLFACLPLNPGTNVRGVQMQEVVPSFADPIPLPISVVPAD